MNSGRSFEDRARGVGRSVEQIVAENRNFFDRNRQDTGTLNVAGVCFDRVNDERAFCVEKQVGGGRGGVDCRV